MVSRASGWDASCVVVRSESIGVSTKDTATAATAKSKATFNAPIRPDLEAARRDCRTSFPKSLFVIANPNMPSCAKSKIELVSSRGKTTAFKSLHGTESIPSRALIQTYSVRMQA